MQKTCYTFWFNVTAYVFVVMFCFLCFSILGHAKDIEGERAIKDLRGLERGPKVDIDNTAPTFTSLPREGEIIFADGHRITVEVGVTDDQSGVKEVYGSVMGMPPAVKDTTPPYILSMPFDHYGKNLITFLARDNAGNGEQVTIEVNIKRRPMKIPHPPRR